MLFTQIFSIRFGQLEFQLFFFLFRLKECLHLVIDALIHSTMTFIQMEMFVNEFCLSEILIVLQ